MSRWIHCLVIVGAMLLASQAAAQPPSANLPSPSGSVSRTSSAKGMDLQVDTRWVAGSSYRPVRILLTPRVPAADTRTFDLRFRARSWYGRERWLEVAQTVDVPPGKNPVNVTLSVPEFAAWQSYNIEVFENGLPIEKLAQTGTSFSNNVDMLEGVPNMLIIGKQAIDTSQLVTAMKAQGLMMQYSSSLGSFGGIASVAAGPNSSSREQLITVMRRNFDELPGRWIDLGALDVVCLSMTELDQLVRQQPGRWKAVRDWVATGGNLWVYDAGEDWNGLSSIEAALSLEANSDAADPASRGWTLPNRSKFREELESGFANSEYWTEPTTDLIDDPLAILFDDMASQPAKPKPAAPQNDFAMHAVGMGQVVAFSSSKLFEQGSADEDYVVDLWRWRVNSIGSDRLLWVHRHGLSTRRENTEFWNFLVPGVGLVPVSAFRVLITLFMVAIGPLNYYWLRRKSRLHLLLVIVPIAAAVITSTLFGYAVVADGFDIRARARSLTHIDQRNRHAVCWSRLSYYAGLAPSGGLTFPEDTAVIPLGPAGTDSERSTPNRYLRWEGDQQMLVSGWLPSRTATQLLTVRSRASEHGIDVLTGSPPQIRNRLGSNIKLLIVNNGDGKLLAARSVAASSTAPLQPADPNRDTVELHRLIGAQTLAIPEGLDPQQYNMFGMRSFYSYARWNNGLNNTSLGSSRLEKNVNSLWNFGNAGQARPADCITSDRWYIAVVDRAPEVLFGVEPVKEEESLHLIVGEF